MKAAAVLSAVVGLVASFVITATPAGADAIVTDAIVTVSPSSGLAGGDIVHVSAGGVTPLANVRVIQCDTFLDDPAEECFEPTSTNAAASGAVSPDVTLNATVFHNQEFGDPRPVYCRADA